MMTLSHPPNRVSNQKTTLPQRRYWPRKKHRSVNHDGRKKRWLCFAGNNASSGRKTATRKRKLMPTEIARVRIISGHRGGAGCCGVRYACASDWVEKGKEEVTNNCKNT